MKRERDTAVRTIPRFAAGAAKERGREPSTIEEEDGLFAFLKPASDCSTQWFGEDRSDFFLPPRKPQIDDPHHRHLAIIHPLGQIEQAIFLLDRGVVTLQ